MEIYQLEQFRTIVVSSLLMPQIAAELPESTFEVVNCSTQDLIAGLQEGRFDVLIATDICRSKSTKWIKLYVEQAFLSAPLAAGFASREAVGSDEMRRLSFSIEAGLPGYSDWYAYLLRNAGVDDSSIESTEFKEHLCVEDTLPTCNLITSFIMSFLRTNDARTIVRIDERFAKRNAGAGLSYCNHRSLSSRSPASSRTCWRVREGCCLRVLYNWARRGNAARGDCVLYQLMNKDVVAATYEEVSDFDDFRYELVDQLDPYLPYGFSGIDDWIDGRQIAKHRASIQKLMRELGLNTRHDFIGMARCLALTDTFWMKRADEGLSWAEVSLYRNPFDDVIARIAFDGTGMYGRLNSPASPEFATSGSFAKCWVREGERISLLKRGSEGYANAGFEPYSEALAASLLAAAKVDHVPYGVVRYHGKIASKCPLFTTEDVGFVSAHRFFEGTFGVRDMLEFCAQHGAEDSFREMVVMDAVMANVDRHSGNYGFLVDNACGRVLGMAPLFDHNMACLPMMMQGDDFDEYVSLIGPKIGTDFTAIGRELMTPSIRAKLVALKDFAYEDPGLGYPAWKLEAVNRLKDRQVAELLA